MLSEDFSDDREGDFFIKSTIAALPFNFAALTLIS